MSCRAALATFDLIEREYMANATARGDQLAAGLADLAEKHGVLANPRGLGLMRAIDVVGDEGPDPALRHALLDAAFHRGLLLLGCGRSAIRFCPALCVTADQIGTALAILDEVVGATASQRH